MKRNIWFWVYFIVAILMAIYFATRIIMAFSGYGATSTIRGYSISADAPDKDLSAIAGAVGISPGTHTYSKNLKLVNENILEIPVVRESAVRRMPNGTLSIKLHLYRAVAAWTDGTYYYPISGDGKVVNTPSETRGPETVVFRGNVPNDITEITKAATNLISDLEYMEWIDNRRWNIVTTGGITVMLPEEDAITAVGKLIALNKNQNILSKKIKVLDMRDNARILVK